MFSYIRLLSVVGSLLIFFTVILLGYSFKQAATGRLLDITEKNHASLAYSFIGTTWKEEGEKIEKGIGLYLHLRASHIPPEKWKDYPDYQSMVSAFSHFSTSMLRYFAGMPDITASIYMTDGTQLVSTVQRPSVSAQGESISPFPSDPELARRDAGIFNVALQDRPVSVAIPDHSLAHPDDDAAPGMLVRTILPVANQGCKEDNSGVHCQTKPASNSFGILIEIRQNVTPQWQHIILLQWIGAGGASALFLVMAGILFFIYGRLERTILDQHEKNLTLAVQVASTQAQGIGKSEFLANASHELRTPLNAIIGFSEFIRTEQSGPVGNAIYAGYMHDIYDAGTHLLSLINDILDYSKAEAGKLELQISEVNLTTSLRNAMRLIGPRAEIAKVRLVDAIPQENFILQTDARKLKQIMLNLLSNAVKFTPAGGSVIVTVWQSTAQGGVSIEVRDTGIGIAPQDIGHVMAPFGQVKSELSNQEGTGLGLPLTQKLVELMGGVFTLTSEVGKGTVVTVILPKDIESRAA